MVKLQNYYVMKKNGLDLKADRVVGCIRWLLRKNKAIDIRLVLLLIGFCFSIDLSAESPKDYLYIHGVQSSLDKSFLLDDVDKITFSEETMNVFQKGIEESVEIDFDSFRVMTFTEKGVESSNVNSIAEDEITLRYDSSSRSVIIESPLPILSVQIYNLNGFLVQSVSTQETMTVVSLENYPTGMYIVKAFNEKTNIIQKIINR